jgi:hypothetical protein
LSAEVADLAARLAAEVATQLEGMLEPTVPLHRQGDMSNVYVACTRHGLSDVDANGLVGRLLVVFECFVRPIEEVEWKPNT